VGDEVRDRPGGSATAKRDVGELLVQLFLLPSSIRPSKPRDFRRSLYKGGECARKPAEYLVDTREHIQPRILDAEAKGREQPRVSAEHQHNAVQHCHRREEQPQQVKELPVVLEIEGLGARQVADTLENAVLDLPPLCRMRHSGGYAESRTMPSEPGVMKRDFRVGWYMLFENGDCLIFLIEFCTPSVKENRWSLRG
jgi:hypothetical protein